MMFSMSLVATTGFFNTYTFLIVKCIKTRFYLCFIECRFISCNLWSVYSNKVNCLQKNTILTLHTFAFSRDFLAELGKIIECINLSGCSNIFFFTKLNSLHKYQLDTLKCFFCGLFEYILTFNH